MAENEVTIIEMAQNINKELSKINRNAQIGTEPELPLEAESAKSALEDDEYLLSRESTSSSSSCSGESADTVIFRDQSLTEGDITENDGCESTEGDVSASTSEHYEEGTMSTEKVSTERVEGATATATTSSDSFNADMASTTTFSKEPTLVETSCTQHTTEDSLMVETHSSSRETTETHVSKIDTSDTTEQVIKQEAQTALPDVTKDIISEQTNSLVEEEKTTCVHTSEETRVSTQSIVANTCITENVVVEMVETGITVPRTSTDVNIGLSYDGPEHGVNDILLTSETQPVSVQEAMESSEETLTHSHTASQASVVSSQMEMTENEMATTSNESSSQHSQESKQQIQSETFSEEEKGKEFTTETTWQTSKEEYGGGEVAERCLVSEGTDVITTETKAEHKEFSTKQSYVESSMTHTSIENTVHESTVKSQNPDYDSGVLQETEFVENVVAEHFNMDTEEQTTEEFNESNQEVEESEMESRRRVTYFVTGQVSVKSGDTEVTNADKDENCAVSEAASTQSINSATETLTDKSLTKGALEEAVKVDKQEVQHAIFASDAKDGPPQDRVVSSSRKTSQSGAALEVTFTGEEGNIVENVTTGTLSQDSSNLSQTIEQRSDLEEHTQEETRENQGLVSSKEGEIMGIGIAGCVKEGTSIETVETSEEYSELTTKTGYPESSEDDRSDKNDGKALTTKSQNPDPLESDASAVEMKSHQNSGKLDENESMVNVIVEQLNENIERQTTEEFAERNEEVVESDLESSRRVTYFVSGQVSVKSGGAEVTTINNDESCGETLWESQRISEDIQVDNATLNLPGTMDAPTIEHENNVTIAPSIVSEQGMGDKASKEALSTKKAGKQTAVDTEQMKSTESPSQGVEITVDGTDDDTTVESRQNESGKSSNHIERDESTTEQVSSISIEGETTNVKTSEVHSKVVATEEGKRVEVVKDENGKREKENVVVSTVDSHSTTKHTDDEQVKVEVNSHQQPGGNLVKTMGSQQTNAESVLQEVIEEKKKTIEETKVTQQTSEETSSQIVETTINEAAGTSAVMTTTEIRQTSSGKETPNAVTQESEPTRENKQDVETNMELAATNVLKGSGGPVEDVCLEKQQDLTAKQIKVESAIDTHAIKTHSHEGEQQVKIDEKVSPETEVCSKQETQEYISCDISSSAVESSDQQTVASTEQSLKVRSEDTDELVRMPLPTATCDDSHKPAVGQIEDGHTVTVGVTVSGAAVEHNEEEEKDHTMKADMMESKSVVVKTDISSQHLVESSVSQEETKQSSDSAIDVGKGNIECISETTKSGGESQVCDRLTNPAISSIDTSRASESSVEVTKSSNAKEEIRESAEKAIEKSGREDLTSLKQASELTSKETIESTTIKTPSTDDCKKTASGLVAETCKDQVKTTSVSQRADSAHTGHKLEDRQFNRMAQSWPGGHYQQEPEVEDEWVTEIWEEETSRSRCEPEPNKSPQLSTEQKIKLTKEDYLNKIIESYIDQVRSARRISEECKRERRRFTAFGERFRSPSPMVENQERRTQDLLKLKSESLVGPLPALAPMSIHDGARGNDNWTTEKWRTRSHGPGTVEEQKLEMLHGSTQAVVKPERNTQDPRPTSETLRPLGEARFAAITTNGREKRGEKWRRSASPGNVEEQRYLMLHGNSSLNKGDSKNGFTSRGIHDHTTGTTAEGFIRSGNGQGINTKSAVKGTEQIPEKMSLANESRTPRNSHEIPQTGNTRTTDRMREHVSYTGADRRIGNHSEDYERRATTIGEFKAPHSQDLKEGINQDNVEGYRYSSSNTSIGSMERKLDANVITNAASVGVSSERNKVESGITTGRTTVESSQPAVVESHMTRRVRFTDSPHTAGAERLSSEQGAPVDTEPLVKQEREIREREEKTSTDDNDDDNGGTDDEWVFEEWTEESVPVAPVEETYQSSNFSQKLFESDKIANNRLTKSDEQPDVTGRFDNDRKPPDQQITVKDLSVQKKLEGALGDRIREIVEERIIPIKESLTYVRESAGTAGVTPKITASYPRGTNGREDGCVSEELTEETKNVTRVDKNIDEASDEWVTEEWAEVSASESSMERHSDIANNHQQTPSRLPEGSSGGGTESSPQQASKQIALTEQVVCEEKTVVAGCFENEPREIPKAGTSLNGRKGVEESFIHTSSQPKRLVTMEGQTVVMSVDVGCHKMGEIGVRSMDRTVPQIRQTGPDAAGVSENAKHVVNKDVTQIAGIEKTIEKTNEIVETTTAMASVQTTKEVDRKVLPEASLRSCPLDTVLEETVEENLRVDRDSIQKTNPRVSELIIQDDKIIQYYHDESMDSVTVEQICDGLRNGAISRIGFVGVPGLEPLAEEDEESVEDEGKMSQKKSVDGCFTWMESEQVFHETTDYGANKQAVGEALNEQRRRVKLIEDFQREVNKASSSCGDKEVEEKLKTKYDSLKSTANKRLCCLQNMSQIAGIEELFGTLTAEFSETATALVQDAATKSKSDPPGQNGQGIARAAQNCILAVRENWDWLSKLAKCTDIHLQNSSEYHQFFHEVDEYGDWMPIELRKVTELVVDPGTQADRNDARRLLRELKTVITIFLHWQAKVDRLMDRAKKVVPVHHRARQLETSRPVTALCNYKTKDVNVREGEELTLLDNSRTQTWQVQNMHASEDWVPAIICLIPPPDPGALEAATRARLQLLAIWTGSLKRIGMTLIEFLLLVFRDWNKDEERLLKNLPVDTKNEITRMVNFIDETLSRHWSEQADFKILHGRFDRLRAILAQPGDPNAKAEEIDNEMGKALVVQIGVIEELMKRYQELWRNWETYKVLVETTRHPEYLLLVDKWEEYLFMSTEELLKKWNQSLHLDGTDGKKALQGGSVNMVEESIEAEECGALEAVNGDSAGISTTIETSKAHHESDTFTTSEQEEKKTFVITGVKDTRTDEEISLDKAVSLGIIDQTTGTYVNMATGDRYPIPVAMNAGLIKVEFTTTKKSAEKRRDIGLITIRTYRESRPYTVKGVIDAKSEKQLSIDEAIRQGVLDQKNAKYYNSMTKENMSFGDAMDSGLLIVEFDKDAEVTDPEVVTKTYAIHAVVDQKRKRRVPFSEAVRMNLIDQQTGAYKNNLTEEQVYIGDAIIRGLIKATIVTDPNSMDIAPENKIVADKLQTIRSKMLKPMAAMAALKKSAATNGK